MKRERTDLRSGLRARRAIRAGGRRARPLIYETLENRNLLSAAPYGAFPDDTAEYMLGDVLVTVVLMESNTNISAVNPNTENWTPAQIAAAKQKVQEGTQWWEQTLAAQFPSSPHQLDFQFDFTYADSPVLTSYEPITQNSDAFQSWMYDFLNQVGHNKRGNFTDDIRDFNHAQRLAHGTDWAFTVFVVNDANDADGMFPSGGSFRRAFSYAGGQFIVSPAGRPSSTFTHETGHMFWARDEYAGGASYSDRRGYYDTQNLNAMDGNPTPGFRQADSIMTTDYPPTRYAFTDAYTAHTSSVSSLEMIGWRDSDGDGIFDVLDVPNSLSGTGFLDPASGQYRFRGESSVQPLPNLNSSGLQNDITLNRIRRAEYRVDGGGWQVAATFDAPVVDLDLSLPVPASGTHTVELRTVDGVSGVASPVFQGTTDRPTSVLRQGINGFVWNDVNRDGTVQNEESPLAGWTVRLVDAVGSPLNLSQTLDPDAYAAGTVLNSVLPQARLKLSGDPTGTVVAIASGNGKVFGNRTSLGVTPTWKPGEFDLRVDFPQSVSSVELDAIGTGGSDRARLDVYDASGVLLGRYTTSELGRSQLETMRVQRPTADIAYAIAQAHAGAGVRLDRLRFGPETVAETDARGAYAITSLPAGSYFVEPVTSSGRAIAGSRREVVLAEGEALGNVSLVAYAGAISWQNPARATDVSGEGDVTPLDALTVINYINAHAGDLRVPSSDVPPPYYDVNGDGSVTAADVLIVINELNAQPSRKGSSFVAAGEGESRTPVPEGEGAVDSLAATPSISTIPLPAHEGLSLAKGSSPQLGIASLGGVPLPNAASTLPPAFARGLSKELHPLVPSAALRSPRHAPREWSDLEEILRDLAEDVAAAYEPSAFVG